VLKYTLSISLMLTAVLSGRQ